MDTPINTFNVDGLNLTFKRHTRKTGKKVTNEQFKADPKLAEVFKYPNKDKSIHYKHPSVEQVFEIDISNMSNQQIIDCLAATAIILQQKDERSLSIDKMKERTNVKIDVASLLDNKRVAKTPEEEIEKNFDKLSSEKKMAMLKRLSQ